MKERPILMNCLLVKASMEGRKTQTRRPIKPQPNSGVRKSVIVKSGLEDGHGREIKCPYGKPGDRLWVRESCWIYGFWIKIGGKWSFIPEVNRKVRFDDPPKEERATKKDGLTGWVRRPSIHMPRWASRLTLEILEIRVERLQDISQADCLAEGCPETHWNELALPGEKSPWNWFIGLWDKINGKKYPSDSNPWVWVIKYRLLDDSR
jgi:hypothetical protein